MAKKRGKRLDALGVSAFCESMALMTQSGIQPDEAVELLRHSDGKGGVLDYALSAMQAELDLVWYRISSWVQAEIRRILSPCYP